jgi:uncharacterized SAM-binding protein YcdF (DUF218 family)
MSLSWLFNGVLGALLLPPLNLILLCGFGLLLARRRPRLGRILSGVALVLLAVLSSKAGALLLVAPLERLSTPLASANHGGASTYDAQAIVVLSGGRLAAAPEYGGLDQPNYWTLARLRYAAHLQRSSGLPLLVSGGRPEGWQDSEALLMARVLRDDFAVPVRWLEQGSDDTAANARLSAALLKPAGVSRIVLVTDAIHMPRARAAFARQGLQVVSAPTVFFSREALTPLDFVPQGEGLRRSYYALHEWLGLAWYRLKYDGLAADH